MTGLLSTIFVVVIGLTWIFILGVLVGRGYKPEKVMPELARIMPSAAPPAVGSPGSPGSKGEEAKAQAKVLKPEELHYLENLQTKSPAPQPIDPKAGQKQLVPGAKPGQAETASKSEKKQAKAEMKAIVKEMRPEKSPAGSVDKNYKPTDKDLKLAGRDVRPAGMDGKPEPAKPGDKKPEEKSAQTQAKDAVYDYTFLAGTFGVQAQAKELQAKLRKAGVNAVIEEASDSGAKTYKVNALLRGKPDDAKALKQKLDAAGAKNALLRTKKPL
jgi:hypothetical protein